MEKVLAVLAAYGDSLLAFAVFALLHSLGAREGLKNALARLFGRFFTDHFWRFLYCALSYLALYHVISGLHWTSHPENDVWLILYPEWLWQGMVVLHLVSIAVFYAAFVQSDYLEFLGLKQIWRGLLALARRKVPAPMNLFGTHRLVQSGVYGFVRHPMLSAGFLFLFTSGPSLNNLLYLCLYTVYMLVGGYFEEARLIGIFGEEYRRYKRQVGMFFPRPALRR